MPKLPTVSSFRSVADATTQSESPVRDPQPHTPLRSRGTTRYKPDAVSISMSQGGGCGGIAADASTKLRMTLRRL